MPQNAQDSQSKDQDFERIVAEFLFEGLHTRRGLTAEEYTALCREAWDKCHPSPAFPFKVLMDPLRPIESMFAESVQEYVHWRAADELEAQREPSTEIRCVALGPVKPDLSTGPDESTPLPTEEPEVPETRRYLLGVPSASVRNAKLLRRLQPSGGLWAHGGAPRRGWDE